MLPFLYRAVRPRLSELAFSGVTTGPAQVGDELAHADPPDPRTDIAVSSPSGSAPPHRQEGVLDRIGHQRIVPATGPQSGDQPRRVPVVEDPERSGVATGDGRDERHIVPLVAGCPTSAHRRIPDDLIAPLSLARRDRDHAAASGGAR